MSVTEAPELFASDEQLAELKSRHRADPQDPIRAIALAWALRQRDPKRCVALARSAGLADDGTPGARLWLIEGERAAATRRPEEAQIFCKRAQAATEAVGDVVCAVDVRLLEFTIAREHSTLPEVLVPTLERLLADAE